ncbi:DUF4395 domain-containing protein [Corynebacterium pacaense]|uniref:DUF4395 domain-containing protein n=1 Tax=Corynebacterium pacaense TaxID=1816684 RepID=UPI0011789D65|nr:DUF4395 domain-containing protein [Corynebacterium pacaense]
MATKIFSFPNPVNEYAARFTAGLVVLLTLATIFSTGTLRLVLVSVLALGFALRVAGGPRYSPFGRLSVHVLAPLLRRGPLLTAGPPKRFAQAIGLAFATTALLLTIVGWDTAATFVLVLLTVAATLESVFGFCLGCWIFGWLIHWGLIPEDVCEECANAGFRYSRTAPADITVTEVSGVVKRGE